MQAIKEKINDLKEIKRAKAEAKQEEKAERELAKARLEVAHEVRMAREAEKAMDYHVQKAAEKAAEHEKKYPATMHHSGGSEHDVCASDDSLSSAHESHGPNASAPAAAASNFSSELCAAQDSGNTKAAFMDAPSSPTDLASATQKNNSM